MIGCFDQRGWGTHFSYYYGSYIVSHLTLIHQSVLVSAMYVVSFHKFSDAGWFYLILESECQSLAVIISWHEEHGQLEGNR